MQQERAENQPLFGGQQAQHSDATQPIVPPVPTAEPPTGTPPFGAPPTGTPPFGAPPTGTPPFGAPPAGAPPAGAPPFGSPFGVPGRPGFGTTAGAVPTSGAPAGPGRPVSGPPVSGPPVSGPPGAPAGVPGMPHVPAQRQANPEYPTGRSDQPTNPEYGREHFTGPLRSNRTAQHRASDEEAAGSDRTVAIPRPAEGNHPANAETMVLPVFVTGKKEPEPAPAPAQPARQSGADGSLPASERGMLVFVAALLGIGTIAVVIMLGVGGLEKHPTQVQPSTPATTAPAGGVPAPTGSSSGLSPSPTPPASPSTAASPTLAKTTAKHIASPAPVLLGQPQPLAYCVAKDHGLAKAPDHDHNTWTCTTGHRGQADPFTPEQVCDWQYGTAAHAVVGSLGDYTTWKCYK